MGGGIFSNSVGHKLVMAVSGLFLVLFLLVHLSMNLTLVLNDVHLFGHHWAKGELFNTGAHFMISTPLIRLMEPVLAAGFIFHIVYATWLTVRNRRFRPVGYAVRSGNHLTSWSSKNMYILGAAILLFLVLHIWNFFYRFRYTEMPKTVVNGVTMDDSFTVVSALFEGSVIYCIVYMVAGLVLGLHLSHGFWSAFQTVGWNNVRWISRLRVISTIVAIAMGVGFAIIPLYFLIVR